MVIFKILSFEKLFDLLKMHTFKDNKYRIFILEKNESKVNVEIHFEICIKSIKMKCS